MPFSHRDVVVHDDRYRIIAPSGEVRELPRKQPDQIVRAALESESSLDPRKIDVENRNGAILLHGSVESEEQREKAAKK